MSPSPRSSASEIGRRSGTEAAYIYCTGAPSSQQTGDRDGHEGRCRWGGGGAFPASVRQHPADLDLATRAVAQTHLSRSVFARRLCSIHHGVTARHC